MAQVNAGRVRFVSRGEYSNATQYYTFDLVNYNGSSYYAKENTLGDLPTDSTKWQLVAEKGNKGDIGPIGVGVQSITKTSTSGLVDTYTITYTNGSTTTFNVSNGKGIVSITKVLSQDNIDTYRITYNDNTYFEYQIENGSVTQTQYDDLEDRVHDLERNQKTGEASGTEIDLTDAFDTRPRYLGIDATETTQETTTGKNDFNMFDFTVSHATIKTLNENLIDLKADTTAGAQFATNYVRNVDATKTYTISFKIKKINFGQDASSGSATIYMYGSNDDTTYTRITTADVVQGTVLNQEYSASRNLTGYSNYRFYFYSATGATVPLNCETQFYDIQFEEGSTATSWEKFSYGAAPNPDYPQDVETMVGYRNLFDKDNVVWYQAYITNGNEWMYSNDVSKSFRVPIEPNKTYIILANNPNEAIFRAGYVKTENTPIATTPVSIYDVTRNTNTNNPIIVNTGDDAKYIVIQVGASQSEITIKSLMVIEGTEQLPYVPYGSNYMVLDDGGGKNRFDKNTTTDGYYLYSNGTTGTSANFCISDYIKVTPNNNYTYQGLSQVGNDPYSVYYDENKQMISSFKQATGENTITIPNNAYFVRFSIRIANPDDDRNTFMLEQGSTATPYEPYHHKYPISLANQELLNKGDYVDKIIVDETNKQAYIEKVFGKKYFKDLNITYASTNSYFYCELNDMYIEPSANVMFKGFSNIYKPTTSVNNAGWASKPNYTIGVRQTTNIVCFKDNDYTDVTSFKTARGENYFYYPLATPQLIPIDNPNIKLLNGVNHITNSEDANMSIVYVKDINAYLDSINARLEALENQGE